MKITSPAFDDGRMIPDKYTCMGTNVNPPLRIEDVPAKAKSLALTVDDPDAPGGTWDHWVVWNIPPEVQGIQEGEVPEQAVQGLNSAGMNRYAGPCPPSGTHRYMFKMYALDRNLDLGAESTKKELENEIRGHILAVAVLVGLFTRNRPMAPGRA